MGNFQEMTNKILRCPECHTYTLKNKCPKCQSECMSPAPAKFSPDDRLGEYRRKYKRNVIQNKSG